MAKAFEFTFTVRSYGKTPDHAFQELQQELSNDLGALFRGFIDYEEVDKELCKKEADELMTTYAEETILETMDPAEA